VAIDRLVPTPKVRRRYWHLRARHAVTAAEPGIVASRSSGASKRLFDVAIAGTLLVLLSPVLLLLAVAIKLDSRGPVLYRSLRVGLHGREFAMLKFRKMRRDAAGPPLTALNDDRLTRMGSLLGRTKLDELPQLWNVVRGEMSLVGPRPEAPVFVATHPDEFRAILEARPGITGLSQLAFAKESSVLERQEFAGRYVDRLLPAKIAIDRMYVAQRSTRIDISILGWTAAAMLLRINVAVDRATGRLSVRRRAEPQQNEVAEQAR
jgi:lipopolysaccharide/colanic/teichoic acid biosynthesis glycosyltransferase